MTYLEASRAAIGTNYPFTENTFNLGLINSGIDPTAPFESGKDFDVALGHLILYLIASADISEGGYSVKLDRKALMDLRSLLLRKWGEDDTQPKIRDKTYLW